MAPQAWSGRRGPPGPTPPLRPAPASAGLAPRPVVWGLGTASRPTAGSATTALAQAAASPALPTHPERPSLATTALAQAVASPTLPTYTKVPSSAATTLKQSLVLPALPSRSVTSATEPQHPKLKTALFLSTPSLPIASSNLEYTLTAKRQKTRHLVSAEPLRPDSTPPTAPTPPRHVSSSPATIQIKEDWVANMHGSKATSTPSAKPAAKRLDLKWKNKEKENTVATKEGKQAIQESRKCSSAAYKGKTPVAGKDLPDRIDLTSLLNANDNQDFVQSLSVDFRSTLKHVIKQATAKRECNTPNTYL
ncbi:hypothetical protein K491DRAFT_683421 [Lophiostoma macrostomum CBS 122681]|uniref:Uncharacterized protein n=1 Tax=Lophiostoma macrostomum CBS 122681 TaxID=1314788 RepID=A0A6A6STZ7_9PLEO|nr:hypothetical protein K491DRAFT_683421 [Lophiostoma macrostomum CBS 122681]